MLINPLRLLRSIVLLGLVQVPVHSASANDFSGACKALDKAKYSNELNQIFTDLQIPTQINQAKIVGPAGDMPSYCQVSGYVTPNVGFLMRLPLEHWNGKLLKIGCGGLCGTTEHINSCDTSLRRGYVCMVSDGAHQGRGTEWMRNNSQAQIDFAYRSTHVATMAGKAIVKWYYGDQPRKSYFMGCSGGGRQAMMEAQRFPRDFNGIVAGAPALSTTGVEMTALWDARAFMVDAKPVLGQAEINLLHDAVLQQCDLNDGIKDGLIGDPRDCHFDAANLLCRGDRKEGCLSSKQLDAIRKIYAGARTSAGEQIYPPAALLGSERTWPELFPFLAGFVADQYGILVHPGAGPAPLMSDFDFDRDYQRVGMAQALWEPVNPDLRPFKATGGKLLLYTGWNDAVEGPLRDVDYYETAERVMGGRAATQDFFRLFVVPGMNHCGGGDGAHAIDYLSAMERWVEHGQPPDKLIGAHPRKESQTFPLSTEEITFSRPIYPYPTKARYRGHGDPDDAASFEPETP